MTKLIWIIAGGAFLVWSGFAWLSHGLLDWIAAFASDHAGQLTLGPNLTELLTWLAGFAASAGGVVIVVIWMIGCAVIAGLALLSSKLLARRRPGPSWSGYRLPPRRD